MISVNDFKTGLTIQIDGELWRVVEFLHLSQVKVQPSFVQNLKTYGQVLFKKRHSVLVKR